METPYQTGSGSKAAIHGHPLHPLLVPLPIGILAACLASDLAFYATGDPFWARGSYWLLVAGLVTGLLAGLSGLIEILGVERARTMGMAWAHGLGNVLALALAAVNLFLRHGDIENAVLPTGLILSIAVVLIVLVTGWLGGEMSYRHGIGVSKELGAPTGRENTGFRKEL